MPKSFAAPPPSADPDVSPSLLLSLAVAGVCIVYNCLHDLLGLPPPWKVIFVMIPGSLLGPNARERLENAFGTSAVDGGMSLVARVRNRAVSLVGGQLVPTGHGKEGEGLIGGLWNTGNTCYQNSVLQAMASLSHLRPHLELVSLSDFGDGLTPSGALMSLVIDLNRFTPEARASTPSPIIVRGTDNSGWVYNEQQDAQEFFQKLTGSLEKEVARFLDRRKGSHVTGLEGVQELENEGGSEDTLPCPKLEAKIAKNFRSPFEGLFAQRVGCLRCGYVEAISLQPFTSLSLSLPSSWSCSLEECLSEFTAIEKIPEVECDKCTLLSLCERLKSLLAPDFANRESAPLPQNMPESLRAEVEQRISALEQAIDEDNFSPNVPGVKISAAHKISSTKTKQTMIARPPPVLVLHINRSQYDVITGMAGKNYAVLSFPARMDLGYMDAVTRHDLAGGSWGLGVDPARPMSGRIPKWVGPVESQEDPQTIVLEPYPEKVLYDLKSVIAHYGGHHNGHYVCYRKVRDIWFRISDHEVYACEEQDALNAGNAFMLFYERVTESETNETGNLGENDQLITAELGATPAQSHPVNENALGGDNANDKEPPAGDDSATVEDIEEPCLSSPPSEAPSLVDDTSVSESESAGQLDELLPTYFKTINKYKALQESLGSNFSEVYANIAEANGTLNIGEYCQDYLTTLRGTAIKDEETGLRTRETEAREGSQASGSPVNLAEAPAPQALCQVKGDSIQGAEDTPQLATILHELSTLEGQIRHYNDILQDSPYREKIMQIPPFSVE